jgi:hypothetical protein
VKFAGLVFRPFLGRVFVTDRETMHILADHRLRGEASAHEGSLDLRGDLRKVNGPIVDVRFHRQRLEEERFPASEKA